MALILSIETSTSVCSAALHESGKLIGLNEIHLEQAHASKLSMIIDQLRSASGIDFKKLSGVAVSSGPGSYTGLRIGASVAKGLCISLRVPLISVETLDILASQVNELNFLSALKCPMIDARRMEVYCKIFSPTKEVILPAEAKVIQENSFEDLLRSHTILFFGNGAAKSASVLTNPNAIFLDNLYPSAKAMGRLAFEKYQKDQIEDLFLFEPFYLKEFMSKPPAQSVNELNR